MARWPAASGGWPVLWLLDGEDNFAIAAMTARRLTKAGRARGCNRG
jgi:predicted alpha/beta superfamily hydrolase